MSKNPLYKQIFQHYEEKIISGNLKPGSKLPIEMEIAKLFNVSRITATRALKELEIKQYIHRIQGSGSYVSDRYLKISNTSDGEKPKVSLISFVLPIGNFYSSDYLRGIEDIAKEKNYFVTYHNLLDNPIAEKITLEKIISSGSHGIILYPTEITKNMALYTKLLINKFPMVLIDRKIPGLDISLVSLDNRKGFYEITSHLLNLGHRKIIFIATSVFNLSSEYERYLGFCQAHIDHGVPLLNKHLYSNEDIQRIPPDYQPNTSLEIRSCHYLFDLIENLEATQKPTAIATVNDFLASLIITTGLERGILIPGDLSVTGFDNLPYASHLMVPLTTMAQPAYEIGKLAAIELFERIASPDRKTIIHNLNGTLIIRASTATANNKNNNLNNNH